MRVDWIEHVIATGGDQYLKTPEHLLPWHVRTMLDVYLALAAFFGGLLWLTLLGLRRAIFGRRQVAAPGAKAPAPGKAEGVKTFHVVASTQPGMTGQYGKLSLLAEQLHPYTARLQGEHICVAARHENLKLYCSSHVCRQSCASTWVRLGPSGVGSCSRCSFSPCGGGMLLMSWALSCKGQKGKSAGCPVAGR